MNDSSFTDTVTYAWQKSSPEIFCAFICKNKNKYNLANPYIQIQN